MKKKFKSGPGTITVPEGTIIAETVGGARLLAGTSDCVSGPQKKQPEPQVVVGTIESIDFKAGVATFFVSYVAKTIKVRFEPIGRHYHHLRAAAGLTGQRCALLVLAGDEITNVCILKDETIALGLNP